jgi:chromosome partitioning protein
MAAMSEGCSVCGKRFDVQFRYQMEERDGGFAFYCSHDCHGRAMRGETTDGVTCAACRKRFRVELVAQVVRVRGELHHACSDACRRQVLAEADGARLGMLAASPLPLTTPPGPAPSSGPAPGPMLAAERRSSRFDATSTAIAHAGAGSTANGASTSTTNPASTSMANPASTSMANPASTPSANGASLATASTAATASASAVPSPGEASVTPLPRRRIHAPARLAIFNHKGGTGKTTTSVSLAAGFANRGLRVLLVDTDSQGNVSVSLGAKAERPFTTCSSWAFARAMRRFAFDPTWTS